MVAMARRAVVIGSGAGGSVFAWVLAKAGWQVSVLEKGRNYFGPLDDPKGLGLPLFGGDELRHRRGFPGTDYFAEPRTSRSQSEASEGIEHSHVGEVNGLPATVGGGTTTWGAGVPRFWKLDFEMRSRLGPVEGTDLADWPFSYDDLVPYYDAVERILGVGGDLARTPDFVLDEMPRGPYPQPPGPTTYASRLFAEGAAQLGYECFPFPEALNTVPFDGRPVCNNCGYCAGYGCPVNARAGAAVSFLRPALLAGARLVTRAMVTKIATAPDGRATHVEYLASDRLLPERLEADVVVLAASAIESARIALLSASPAHPGGLGNRNGRVGRTLCFHTSTFAAGIMPQRLHAYRGRTTSNMMLEPAVPSRPRVAKWAGLPWIRAGVVEVGGSTYPIDEALLYDSLPMPRTWHKDLMRSSPLRDRLLGVQMLGEDLPQLGNRVDLDSSVKDIYGLPVARITYSLHRHEKVASFYWGSKLREVMLAAGADRALFYPAGIPLTDNPTAKNTRHILGTLRMGDDPDRSVCDGFGRMHGAPNVVVGDGSVFPTSGAFNPTLTLMAVALRSATALAHGEGRAREGPIGRGG